MTPPALLPFFSSVWVAFSSVLFMPTAAADGRGGQHCPPVLCGDVSLRFPFGLIPDDTAVQNSCSSTGFQVHCRNQAKPYLGYYQTEFGMQIDPCSSRRLAMLKVLTCPPN
ncbi:unnamed protein product [Urochloa humidicola]